MYQFFDSTNITNYLKTSLTSYMHRLHYMYYFNLFGLCSLLTGSALPNRDHIVSDLSKMIGWEKCHLGKHGIDFIEVITSFFTGIVTYYGYCRTVLFSWPKIYILINHKVFSGSHSGQSNDMIHSHPLSMIPALFSPGWEYQEYSLVNTWLQQPAIVIARCKDIDDGVWGDIWYFTRRWAKLKWIRDR